MGYTHYWYIFEKEIPKDIWENFATDFVKLVPHFYDILDQTTEQKLNIDNEEIIFNGVGENSHETFYINRKNKLNKEDNSYFNFCKTARKPYDIAVCCTLIIAKYYFGNGIRISSDGQNNDRVDGWDNATELCQKILKYGKRFNISHESGIGEFGDGGNDTRGISI